MHLSREELVNAIYRANPFEALQYEEWLDPIAGRIGREPAEATEQVEGRPVDGPESVPETSREVHPAMGFHSDGCECYATRENYDAFAP